MPTGEQLTEMYRKINRITADLATGEINSYADALALVQELLDVAGDYIDSYAAAKSYLSSAGFNSQADVGKEPVKLVEGPLTKPPVKRDAQGNIIKTIGARPEETEAFGAYQRGLAGAGLPTGIGGGEFGNYLRGRFDPTFATFQAQQALRGPGPKGELEPENAFEEYSKLYRGGNLGLQAQNLFGRLMNKQRGGGGLASMEEAEQNRLSPFLDPTDPQQGVAMDLAREALRGRLGGLATAYLMPSNAALLQKFRGGPIGAQSQDYLAWLEDQFGLR